MKRKHLPTQSQHTTYFLTTTVTESTRIFYQKPLAQILLENLSFYVTKFAIDLHGFVIMPTHIHVLTTMSKTSDVSKFMGKLKEYSAKQIIKWCQEHNEEKLLEIFSTSADKYSHTHQYQVWQKRFDELVITTTKTFDIKLNYIHNNPAQEHWQLCARPELYSFSSARYYVNGEDVGVPITKLA